MSGIYQIRNTVNGKRYIGSAVNLPKRFSDHRYGLNKGDHRNSKLQRAWIKYGKDSFCFEIVELADPADLLHREQHYIDLYHSYGKNDGYNICPVAGNKLGVIPSIETRNKMSESGKKRPPVTDETRAKLSATGLGRKRTAETIAKQVASRKYKPLTESHKQRLRSLRLGSTSTEEHKKAISTALNSRTPEQKAETARKKSESLKKMHANRTDEQRQLIRQNQSVAAKGKIISTEQRRKISATLTGRKLPLEHCQKIRDGKRIKRERMMEVSNGR